MNRPASRLPAIVEQHQKEILAEWLSNQTGSGASRAGRIQEAQLRDESQRFLGAAHAGNPAGHRVRYPQLPMGRGPRVPHRAVAQPRDARLHALADGHVRLLPQAAAVRAAAARAQERCTRRSPRTLWNATSLLDALGLLHDRGLSEGARGDHRAAAAGAARAVDAGREAVGGHPGAAADRHARQRAHAGRDGEPAAADRRDRRRASPSSTSPACRRSTRWSRSTC